MAKKSLENELIYSIYKHVSPSGKYYIGLTKLKCLRRWGRNGQNYLKKSKHGEFIQPYFAHAILKYGWDNFQHLILYTDLSSLLADILEKQLIEEAKMRGLSYNLAPGGTGVYETGFHHSLLSKDRISNSLKGRLLSEEHKKRIGESNKGRKVSEDTKQKISNAVSKSIEMYTKQGEYIRSFSSISLAASFIGKTPGHISKCCKGLRKTAYGFIWKYELSKV